MNEIDTGSLLAEMPGDVREFALTEEIEQYESLHASHAALMENVGEHMSSEDAVRVSDAFWFGYYYHDQKPTKPSNRLRKDGVTHFMDHPTSVAVRAAQDSLDVEMIQGALLHDVLEDTEAEHSDIEEVFGTTVSTLVDGVTDVSHYEIKEDNVIASLTKKYQQLLEGNLRIIILKLRDRLHNMQTLSALSRPSQIANAQETINVYAPLARQLGMREIHDELLFLSHTTLGHKDAEKAWNQRNDQHADRDSLEALEDSTKDLLPPLGIEVQVVPSPYKSHIAASDLGDIHPPSPIAYISFDDQVYAGEEVASYLLDTMSKHGAKLVRHSRYNAYILVSDEVEAIIMAQPDFEAHWIDASSIYTYGVSTEIRREREDVVQTKLEHANEIVQTHIGNGDSGGSEVDHVAEDLAMISKTIITPEGRQIKVPFTATPLDFAARIHGDLVAEANVCLINGNLSPLHARVREGDVVEIVVSDSVGPVNLAPGRFLQMNTRGARRVLQHYVHACYLDSNSSHAFAQIETRKAREARASLKAYGFKAEDYAAVIANYDETAPEIAVDTLVTRFADRVGHEPRISLSRVWQDFEKIWIQRYSSFDEFLIQFHTGMTESKFVQRFLERAMEIDSTIVTLAPIITGNERKVLDLITEILSTGLDINIARVETAQNYQAGNAGVFIDIEPHSELNAEEVHSLLINALSMMQED